jgi:WhiB family redox-sensing transcriptional regulator
MGEDMGTSSAARIEIPARPTDAWRRDAACGGVDPELFYPERGGGAEADEICARCPVAVDCLATALDDRECYGIWGGMSVRSRRVLLRSHQGLSGREIALLVIERSARDSGAGATGRIAV